jgi:hypothetical protein
MTRERSFSVEAEVASSRRRMAEAFSKGDALQYFHAANETGAGEDVDLLLYEIGQAEAMTRDHRIYGVPLNTNPSAVHYARIAKIALRKFPECLPNEEVLRREMILRLMSIKSAGYEVRIPDKNMPKSEVWAYLNDVRGEIRRLAGESCPDVLKQIDEEDRERTQR